MKNEKKENNSEKVKLSRKQKILISSIAILTGFSGTIIGSSLIAYNALFPRYERPDYAVRAGICCYERVASVLTRDEFYFQSKEAKLKAYYYPGENAKGLVVVAHGYHAGADDLLPVIQYLVNNNFNVFTYDLTGTYSSGGDSTIGWCQTLVDLDYALKYIGSTEPYSQQPLFLLGHSWGGYAVTSALELHKNIKACAGIAPMNNGSTIMLEKGEQYVGKLASLPKPIINAYQKLIFGKYVNYNGVKGINSTDAPVFIAQGIDDSVITYQGQSVMAHKDEITNPNVQYYEGLGLQGGHESILNSINAIVYQNKVKSNLQKLKMENGGKLTRQQEIEFFQSVNHQLYSEVNCELMDKIIATFNSTL
ncbi:MAG: alpha/beta fold hydrolase [Clostridia bacterium]|nr:alpha/beta fold hydrolase [Clostridia bacterium]